MALTLEIVTPEKQVYSAKVSSVLLPTRNGEVEILPGHLPLLTIMEAGEIAVRPAAGGQPEYLAVDKGFARVQNDVVSVLVEAAIEETQIDRNYAADAQKRAEEALRRARIEGADPAEIERLESVARFSMIQQIISSKHRN